MVPTPTGGTMDRKRLFWTLQIGGWIAYGISSYLAVLPGVEGTYGTMAILKVIRTAVGFGLSLLAWPLLRAVRDRIGGLLAPTAAVLGAAGILGPAWLWLYWTTTAPLRSPELFPTDWSMFARTSLDHAFVFLVWGALFFGASYWQDAAEQRRRTSEARARAHEAELGMLRYQLNPHFLFNALASLRAAIPAEEKKARTFVERIASFLRYALDTSDRNRVPLHEELSAARDYLAVEKARWGNDLEVVIDADDRVSDVEVPGFLLHPVVENAVKHGMASGARPLAVKLRARHRNGDLVLEVVNDVASWHEAEKAGDGAPPPSDPPGGGMGLENARRRLDNAFGAEAELRFLREASRARVVIVIPVAPEASAAPASSGAAGAT